MTSWRVLGCEETTDALRVVKNSVVVVGETATGAIVRCRNSKGCKKCSSDLLGRPSLYTLKSKGSGTAVCLRNLFKLASSEWE